MIKKWYEVSCDLCGCRLNHYACLKPTPTKLRKDGIKVVINNGKIHTYCKNCYNKISRGKTKMDISEARKLKEKLEVDIAVKVQEFQRETGLRVEDIEISTNQVFNAGDICPFAEEISINLEIKI